MNFRTRQEEMRVRNRPNVLNSTETIEDIFSKPFESESWNDVALDQQPLNGTDAGSFILTTEQCAYIHGGLLAGVFIIGILRLKSGANKII